MTKPKLIRITTVPLSLDKLLSGQLRYMNTKYEVIAVSSEKEYLERVGQKEAVRTFHLEMSRKITPIKDLIAVIKLYFFLKKEKPLIVHTHTPKAGIVGMLAAKLAKVPYRLHTVAGLPLLETTGIKRKLLDWVEKCTYALATQVYPNSFGLKTIIIQNKYCHSQKLKVIANGSSNGIDTDYFSPTHFTDIQQIDLRKQLGIDQRDFVFVFVGRLVSDKGVNETVEAFQLLQKETTDVKLLLVGDYETHLDPLLPQTLQAINLNKAIITTGFQADVRPFLAISNVLVFPSYREGFPNVVMQAGAMSLPSIVSDINGCNEIIEEEKNGVIIPVKNARAILDKMRLFLTEEAKYVAMQKKARPMIMSRFNQEMVWKAITDEYASFL
jgi:glycosyltransferase involved in cell wall biosynthesis